MSSIQLIIKSTKSYSYSKKKMTMTKFTSSIRKNCLMVNALDHSTLDPKGKTLKKRRLRILIFPRTSPRMLLFTT